MRGIFLIKKYYLVFGIKPRYYFPVCPTLVVFVAMTFAPTRKRKINQLFFESRFPTLDWNRWIVQFLFYFLPPQEKNTHYNKEKNYHLEILLVIFVQFWMVLGFLVCVTVITLCDSFYLSSLLLLFVCLFVLFSLLLFFSTSIWNVNHKYSGIIRFSLYTIVK